MGEWKEYKLGDIASFEKENISVSEIKIDNYISTENMIPNKGGVVIASKKPNAGLITRYYKGEILISNIRPYFKKIWLANKDGGCSKDVLCIKADSFLVNNVYLYYLLCCDVFFEYVMLGSKGCKMPRGDKSHIMSFSIILPPLSEQKRIASILSSLDDKIDLLHRENETLEAMAKILLNKTLSSKENNGTIEQLISIQNGFAFKSKDFTEQGVNRVIKIKNISEGIIDINKTDYIDNNIIKGISSKFKIYGGDILIAMTGAEIGKLGIIPSTNKDLWLNQRVGKLVEKYLGAKYIAYLHLQSDYGQNYISNTATGSAQPNISSNAIEHCGFPNNNEIYFKSLAYKLNSMYAKIVFNLGHINNLLSLQKELSNIFFKN